MTWSLGNKIPLNENNTEELGLQFTHWLTDVFGVGADYNNDPLTFHYSQEAGLLASSVLGMLAYVINPAEPEAGVYAISGNADIQGPATTPKTMDLFLAQLRGVTVPLLSPRTLTATATAVTIVSSNAEASLFTYTIPGATTERNPILGGHYGALALLSGTFLPNDGSDVTIQFKIKHGGTTIYDDTVTMTKGTARQPWRMAVLVASANSNNAQTMHGEIWLCNNAGVAAPTTGLGKLGTTVAKGGPIGSNPAVPLVIDTTADSLLDITAKLGVSSATVDIVMEYATVMLIG